MVRTACLLVLTLSLSACGGGASPAAAPVADRSESASTEAISRIGDVTIRASAVQTSMLNAAVAQEYGIGRDATRLLLLVAVQRGPESQETSLPAVITATATDLSGRKQGIQMRELRVNGQLDYIGTVDITLPDTLRFDLNIVREGGASSSMQFSREFYPR